MNDKKKEYSRKYYQDNKERILRRVKKHREENKESINEYHRGYYQKNREELKKYARENFNALPLVERWARCSIYTHKSKGYEVRISPKELIEIAEKKKNCELCGVELQYYKENRGLKKKSATLDRMNNGKTINKENILILCWECNVTKGQRTMREFHEYCKFIAEKDFSPYEKK